jgi:hypothetical protein
MADPLWRQAINEELIGIMKNNCFRPVFSLPTNRKALTTKLVFKTKRDVNGLHNRRKAYFVVRRFLQQYGIDYCSTYSPVIGSSTLRPLLAAATILNSTINIYDATQAYLHGNIFLSISLPISA